MSSLAASPLWANEINSKINNEINSATDIETNIGSNPDRITLSASTQLSSEGYFVLTWNTDPSLIESLAATDELLLFQADNREMQNARLRQKLPSHGTITLSGFDNGDFYFRVDAPQYSSPVVHVEVKHHSLNKAIAFFSVGLLLFCILGISIFVGHKKNAHRKSGLEHPGKNAA